MSTDKSKALKKIKGSNNILHSDSGLVLKSAKERVVVGRFENNEVVLFDTLDKETLSLCEELNLEYDKTLVSEDVEQVEESNSQEEEEEEEGEDEGEVEENVEEIPQPSPVENEPVSVKQVPVEVAVPVQKADTSTNSILSNVILFSDSYSKSLQDLRTTVSTIEQEYLVKIVNLENNLASKTQECNEVKSQFDALNAKFQGIKSLFS